MPLFMIAAFDKADSLPLRMATREAHLAYMGARRDAVKLGGPMLDEAGDMAGSLLIVEVADLAAAQALSAADPYRLAGLFERVEVKAFRATLGQL